MDKVTKSLTFLNIFIIAFGLFYFGSKVNKLENDNVYMIEQVKKLDENIIAIECILKDQSTINDELANRLGNYADNVRAVNELLAKLKE